MVVSGCGRMGPTWSRWARAGEDGWCRAAAAVSHGGSAVRLAEGSVPLFRGFLGGARSGVRRVVPLRASKAFETALVGGMGEAGRQSIF